MDPTIVEELVKQPETLLTKAEVAARLRVHPDTVGRMIKDGRLEAIKAPGRAGHFRISEEALAEYKRQNTVPPATG